MHLLFLSAETWNISTKLFEAFISCQSHYLLRASKTCSSLSNTSAVYFMQSKLGSLWNQCWLYNHCAVSLNMGYYQEHSFWRIFRLLSKDSTENLSIWHPGRKEIIVGFSYFISAWSNVSFGPVCLQTMLTGVLWNKITWIFHSCVSGQLFKDELTNVADSFTALSVLKFLGNVRIVWGLCWAPGSRVSSVYRTNFFW